MARGDSCEVCGKTDGRISSKNGKYGMSLCEKHRGQMVNHGKILNKTRFDPNEIVVHEDYAEVILYDQSGNEQARTIVDIGDVDRVKKIRWSYDKAGIYATTTINNKAISMHRFITECPCGLDPDHINNNGLDNRKSNLRIVTRSQNSMNSHMKSNNTSGVTGVSWDKMQKQWHVKICVKYKQITIGYYPDLEDAIDARMAAVKKYHGNFAYKGVKV